MKKIPIREIKKGNIVGRDIRTSRGQLLYSAGAELDTSAIERLSRQNIREVFIKGHDLPEELEHFDSRTLKRLESSIESRFSENSDNDIMRETMRVSKKLIIERSLKRGEILTKSQMYLLQKMKNLPPIPELYRRILEAISRKRTTITTISTIVSSDKVISGKLVQILNTDFCVNRNRIDSIERALPQLGFKGAANLVFALSLPGVFRTDDEIVSDRKSTRLNSSHYS